MKKELKENGCDNNKYRTRLSLFYFLFLTKQ